MRNYFGGRACWKTKSSCRSLFFPYRCRNESSPFATSQECMGNNDGIPPFVINCGTFVISEAGPTKHECEYGYCTTADHGSCMQVNKSLTFILPTLKEMIS